MSSYNHNDRGDLWLDCLNIHFYKWEDENTLHVADITTPIASLARSKIGPTLSGSLDHCAGDGLHKSWGCLHKTLQVRFISNYLYITVHTGSAKVRVEGVKWRQLREKQESKGSLDSVQQATQVSGRWDPSDYKSEEQQLGGQVVILILLGLLHTDYVCTCLVWLRWSVHNL